MFHHILVPLDSSTRAEQVLPVAARLVRASGGSITLLQVINFAHEALYQGPALPYMTPGMIDDYENCARNYLEQVCQYRSLEGITVRTDVVRGNPAEAIISYETEPPIDLILLCSHGYTGVKRWLLGSTSENVARHALVPVLMIRDGKPLRTHHHFEGSRQVRALVPLDTSPRSLDVLVPAAELVRALSTNGQGALHLVRMVPHTERLNPAEQEAALLAADQSLTVISQTIHEGLVARFGPELHPDLSWSAQPTTDIAADIALLAENGDDGTAPEPITYDLIALTTHGVSGIHRWPLGSIAERVLHHTRLPIFVVRPEDMIVQMHQRPARREHTTLSQRH